MNNGKNVLAVFDLEAAYACNFVEYVHRKNSMPFDIQAFTGLESLKAFAAKQKIEILLISDQSHVRGGEDAEYRSDRDPFRGSASSPCWTVIPASTSISLPTR